MTCSYRLQAVHLTYSITIAGAAPKDFIKIYEYGEARKASPSQWPGYIAKVGHKWYPNESITEHLMTCIGKIIDANVAGTRLMLAKGQLRLLSKHFLNPDRDRLVHGSEIFSAHFDDEAFVQEVVEEVELIGLYSLTSVLMKQIIRFIRHNSA